jgi:uncharacterized membrane protein (UPF0136 family)
MRGQYAMKIFLRILSVIYAFAAVLHIGSILGLGRIPFSEAPLSWQLSDIFYGAIDTIAAVGLFQQKSWGVAAFFVAAISEVLLFTLVPQWFVVEPAQLTMLRGFVAYHLVAISIYFVLRHFKIA